LVQNLLKLESRRLFDCLRASSGVDVPAKVVSTASFTEPPSAEGRNC
jgi:hypothetical protein